MPRHDARSGVGSPRPLQISDEIGQDLGLVGVGDEVPFALAHRELRVGNLLRERFPQCLGTSTSAVPCQTAVGTRMSAASKPHGRAQARYSSTMPCVDDSAVAAAVRGPGIRESRYGRGFGIRKMLGEVFVHIPGGARHLRHGDERQTERSTAGAATAWSGGGPGVQLAEMFGRP